MTRTCLGRIVKRPGHLKDDVTWTLATEHWTLTLLLAFEYLLLTTWGCCYWTYTLENLRDIFRITHANTCSWTLALSICIRVFDIELMLLGMINSHFPFLWFNSDLVLNSFIFVLVLYIFFFFILGGCDMLRDFLLCQWFPLCSVVVKNHVLRNEVVIHSSVSGFHELYTWACVTVIWHWPEDSLFNTVNWP